MTSTVVSDEARVLVAAGLAEDEVERWFAARPEVPGRGAVTGDDLPRCASGATAYLQQGIALLRHLPAKPRRSEREAAAARAIHGHLREARTDFLRTCVSQVYADLTHGCTQNVRAAELVYLAAERFPGLTPTRALVDEDHARPLKEKEGWEIDQGLFVSHVLAHPRAGAHFVHAMLRPKPDSLERLPELQRTGYLDLGTAEVRREGKAGYVFFKNLRFLNAEDDATNDTLETATDLVLLDPSIEVGVLRGSAVDHPKYAGRRVFNAGINLTQLYRGKVSYLFYITRDMGYVNKLYRGLTPEDFRPGEPEGTLEKPWIAAVEAFAIGGGCQLLLVMDHVLAEQGSYFNLPARKEGIIPGAANLRLTRFVGDRLARQGILFDRRFDADSPEGRLLCDEVVPPGEMDAAVERTVQGLTSSGVVSAAGNRKALRVAQEPIEQFQAYMATYAREQAYCHLSPQLVRNLEQNWGADKR